MKIKKTVIMVLATLFTILVIIAFCRGVSVKEAISGEDRTSQIVVINGNENTSKVIGDTTGSGIIVLKNGK